jgi:hypothetical protein
MRALIPEIYFNLYFLSINYINKKFCDEIMGQGLDFREKKMLYCICPSCKIVRKKENGKYTIIKKGYERNGVARFLCLNCDSWFNEISGDFMSWFER